MVSPKLVFTAAWLVVAGTTATILAQEPPSDTATIQLISPNGGEVLDVGSTYRITWTGTACQPFSDYEAQVFIALYKNGQRYAAMDSAPLSAGGVDWTPCSTIADGDNYSIHVQIYNCQPWPQDDSDQPFSIRSAVHPAMTILNPSGNEPLQAGQPLTVRWSSTDLPDGDVAINIHRANGWTTELGRAMLAAGKLDVSLPDYLWPGADYRIGVSWGACTPVIAGYTGWLTIQNPVTSGPLQIASPNGGEVWQTDEPMIVAWTGPAVDLTSTFLTCEIESSDGSPSVTLPYVIASPYRLLVWLCPDQEGDGRFIHLTVPSGGVEMTDRSDAPFSVRTDRHPSLTLLEPNGGQVLRVGEPVMIRWSASGIDDVVSAWLYKNGVRHSWLGYAPAALGQMIGTICPDVEDGADYTISVEHYTQWCYPGVTDHSDAPLTVTGGWPAPTFVVTSPRPGDSWTNSTQQKITWTGTHLAGDMLIELYGNGGWVAGVGSATAEAGELTFDLCVQNPGDHYQLHFLMESCSSYREYLSEELTIVPDPRPSPTITLTSPNGGEVIAGNSHRAITWTSTGEDGLVFASLLLGTGFIRTIGTAPLSAGRLEWDVCPYGLESDQYKVSVEFDAGCSGLVENISDAPFTLTGLAPTPQMQLAAPVAGDVVQAGTTTRISWTATHPAGMVGITLSGNDLPDVYLGEASMAQGYFDWQVCPWQTPGSTYVISFSPPPCTEVNWGVVTPAFTIRESGLPGVDLDHDCDVDTADLALLARCFTGPGVPYDLLQVPPGCPQTRGDGGYLLADLDHDGDVDQDDVGLLQRSLNR